MNTAMKNEILAHAESCYPRECCGLLVNINDDTVYWPCRNQAVGTDHFVLHPEDYAQAEDAGEVIAVVHSHPDGPAAPSQADRVACEATAMPWHIVTWPNGEWVYLEPTGYEAPLIGRHWSHGVLDCYSIIRDWYRLERGITLPDFERADEWWHKGQNLYVENFKAAGFTSVPMEELQPGDVLLMQVASRVSNHGAVYLGNNIMLHHLHRRLSCRAVFDGYYRKHCTMVLRYGGST